MHRSGTSALAGALSHLGVQFVSRHDEMPGAPDNPKGFFERPSIVNFNDTLLETHAWAWHTVNLYSFDVHNAVGLLPQGHNLIANLSNDSPVGIKDPRSCLLLPFWRRALLDRFEAIVITRDPAEVAWSLHLRDGLPVTVGLALWIAYNTHLAHGIQGMNPHILRYENLMDSPTTELTSVAQFLHDRGTPISQELSDIEVAAKSIDPTLRRATFPDWLETHPLTMEARSIRETFHQSPSTDLSLKPSELCQEVLDLHRTSIRVEAVQHQYNIACADLQNERSNHESVIAHSLNDYTKVSAIVAEQVDELTTAKTELEHRLSLLSRELELTRQQLERTANSSSLRLGLLLTWPVRKLRRPGRPSRP
jgi:hypothetical protein